MSSRLKRIITASCLSIIGIATIVIGTIQANKSFKTLDFNKEEFDW